MNLIGEKQDFEKSIKPIIPYLHERAKFLSKEPEDLVQNTLLKAYKYWDRFDGTRLKGWLFCIMKNLSCSDYRHNQLKIPSDIMKDEERTPETIYSDKKLGEDIDSAFKNIPEKFRESVYLHFKGITYKEIANMIGEKQGTVQSRVFRGVEYLKTSLINQAKMRKILDNHRN